MMRKRFLSLTCALVLCLSLLPATALAAEGAPGSLYVAGQQITDEGYYTQSGGNWTKSGDASTPPSAPYFHYTKGNDNTPATLTLSGATIQGGTSTGSVPYGAGIYAQCNSGGSVSLTIELIGENTITGYYGIYVNAEISADSYGTDASLTITGESNGSLKVSGSYHGIYVKSGTGGASLNINDASVVASSSSSNFGYAGVYVQSSAHATSSPQLSLAVDGGSLTTSASEGNDGIQFYVGSSQASDATTSLTVSENAIVDARNGGISALKILETLPTPTPTGNNSSGIVFDGTEGTVYGKVTLDESLTIDQGETLTVPSGAELNCNGKLTNNGTILASGGTVTGSLSGGTPLTTPSISQQPQSTTVTEGSTAEFSITASDAQTYQWQRKATYTESEWENISDATTTSYTTADTTTDMSGYQYRCVVKSASGVSVISQTATLTVQAKPASVPVTGVTLNTETLELFTGNTATLTATVQPSNATNQNVTWSSDKPAVATVEGGTVTARGAGEATITVTTADGNKTATCTVTVTHVHTTTKTEARPATCTEAGNTEYWYCSGCHKYFADEAGTEETTLADTVIPATGHTFRGGWCAVCGARDPNYVPPANPNYRVDVTATEGGAVTKDPAAAKAGETVTLTPAPEEGYEVGEVIVTDRFGDTVDVTANPDGTYTFTMPNGQVKVEVTFVESQPEPLPFTDVKEGDWFHDAVRYVYDNGLMDGVGDGQFAPNATTNRAMVVTILYRLAGEPDVSGDVGFADVESGLWYSNAVLWAAEKGIVNGISETEFAPGEDITREQLATILYRYAESMGYDVSASVDLSGFPDAGDIQSYATQALSWAVAEGLLQGFEDDSLQPGGTATRAQIAAILMRFLAAAPTA